MKICTKCGIEVNDDSRYCKACGSGVGGREEAALKQEKKARVLAAEKKGPRIAVVLGIAQPPPCQDGQGTVMRGGPSSLRTSMRMTADGGKGMVTTVQAVDPENGAVRIPLAALQDGKAHFFSFGAGERTVRFFALRKSDGSIGVALDACNACYRAKRGYRQDGDQVICNNCGMAFRPEDIGVVTGGCNPIPLVHTVTGDAVVVKTEVLEQGRKYF
jgi:RNA polymerase subunit RPABC4/transcription elongation factor Spt4